MHDISARQRSWSYSASGRVHDRLDARLLCWGGLGLAHIVAAMSWPFGRPGFVFAAALVLLVAAVISDRAGRDRARLLVMACA